MRLVTAIAVTLVAGVAAAQPGPTNCRSAAYNCNAAKFVSGTSFLTSYSPGGDTGVVFGLANLQAGLRFDTSTNTLGLAASNGVVQWRVNGGTGALESPAGIDRNVSTAGYFWSGSNAGFYANTAGTKRFYSDGTTLLANDTLAATGADTQDLGTTAGYWRTLYLSRGVSLGEAAVTKWTAPPISDNTTRQSQLVWNSDAQEAVVGSSSRKYNPLGQRKEWTVEKRSLDMDIGIENSNCPVLATGIRGTGAAAVTVQCTDAAAAGIGAISGEHYRVMNTTTTANTVSFVDLSGDVTELAAGPKLIQRISIPSGSTASVRIWVAIVPDGTSLSGVDTGAVTVTGFRFSTAVPDTNWQACSGDGASIACTDTGVAPTTGTNLVLEVDCRETTACRFLINGSLVATRSSTLPASGTNTSQRVLVQTTNTTAKALWHGRSSLLTN